MTYYDDIATGYNELHKEEQIKKIKIIKQNLTVEKKYRLLDIGCGTGISFEFFECKLFGIDPSIELLKQIPSRFLGKVQTKTASAEKIPFPDKLFDIIISITAIQNFEDIDASLQEIKRVSKPQVQIVISCLKRSTKLKDIKENVKKYFAIKKEIDEEKDIIWFLTNHNNQV